VNVKEFDDGDRAAQERFKKFSSVDRFEADLSAGDVLYTPPGWWHEVDSLSEGISITVPFSMRQNSPVPPNFVS
jgi:ribosomal protein L16 Arg81 hydroxylase